MCAWVGGEQDSRSTHLCMFPKPPASQPSRGQCQRCELGAEGRARRVCLGETLDVCEDAVNADSRVERSPPNISSPPQYLSLKVSAVSSSGSTWIRNTVHIFPPTL